MDSETFKQILALSGIGAKKAEALYNAGFRSIDDIRNASLEDLMKVKGIGETLARRIKEAFEQRDEEDGLKLYLCPNCGAFVSDEDKVCPKCGTPLNGEEEIEKSPETLEIEDKLVEKEADGFWYKKDEHKLVICPECGAFIPEDAKVCPKCGTIFEGEEEIEGHEKQEEGPVEADGHWYKEPSPRIYLCPECGAFVSEEDKVCPKCGTPLNGEEEIEKSPETLELEDKLVEKEADGFWYKKDEHKLVICPECGAFIPEDAKVCPKCGTVFEGEEEIEPRENGEESAEDADGFWYRKKEQNLMMCPECGAFIPEDAKVCPKCGARFEEDEETLPEIPLEIVAEIKQRKDGKEENIEIEDLLEEKEEDEEEYEENGEEERRRKIADMGEELGRIFEKPSKTGVSKEFVSRWESLFKDKPYGPESAYEESEEDELEEEPKEEKEERKERKSLSSINVYSKKGLTNGLTNGKGYRNGEIRISRTNGRTNGIINGGKTNGLTNGFINGGLVNGNGFINGGESLLDSISEERSMKRGLVPIVLIIVLLIVTPLLMSFLITPVPKEINIGGGFGDWQDIVEYPDSTTDQLYDNNINFEALKVYEDWEGLAFYARIVDSGRLFQTGQNGVSSILIFIDSDSRASTGYYIKGIGADYMIDIDGWNGTAHNHNLYVWNSSRSQDDWNGWTLSRSVPVNNNQREIETKVYLENSRNPRVIFASRDYFGNEDFSDVIISTKKGALRAEEFSIGPAIVHRNEESALLKIDLRAYGSEVHITGMRFRAMKNDTISTLRLYEDDGNGIFDSGDRFIVSTDFSGDYCSVNLSMSIYVNTNMTLLATAIPSSSAAAMDPVGIYLHGIDLSSGCSTIISHLSGGSYLDQIPSEPKIDGSFHDWDGILKNEDPAGDVLPADNPNIDIAEYSIWPHNGLYFYVDVDGNMLGGEDMPFIKHRPRPITDHDHDGIPDSQDPYPYDFNNDGIPDNESYVTVNGEKLPDKDGDGIPDYPYGPDKWLNNTETGVHLYIGPVRIPMKAGYDYVMLFVDIDGNLSTGYRAPWLPMGADHLIRIEGRDMRINSSALLAFTGNDQHTWKWSIVEPAQAAMGEHEIECGLKNLSVNGNSSFFIYTTDWEKNRDMGDGVLHGTRSSEEVSSDAEGGTVTKTLHLRSKDKLKTTTGKNKKTIEISNGEEHTWVQWRPFYTDFHIINNLTVYLYMKPTAASGIFNQGNPDVTVSLYHNGTSIGSATVSDISSEGWYEFNISVGDLHIPKGEKISINVSVSSAAAGIFGSDGYVDLYYNSKKYDSRIVMPTDTYVNVESIETYNSTSETEIFYGGEKVHIVANISDPFGYNDISGAEISIIGPDGNVLVQGDSMDLDGGSGANATFSYDFQTTTDAKGGEYSIEVTGIESNGVTDTGYGRFIIPSEYGVSVYPDQTKEGGPNEVINFNFTVENIGNMNDTYDISITASQHGWSSELWNGSEEVAYDSDGDGVFDWVNPSYDANKDGHPEFFIPSFHDITLTLKRSIPSDADSTTDTVSLIALSESNSSVIDGAKATINCPYPYNKKTLHLHSDDSMDTFTGSSQSTVQINNGAYHIWTQNPPFALDFNISSYISVYLYVDPEKATGIYNEGYPDITVNLTYNGGEIGSYTISDVENRGWYVFTIDAGGMRIPSGSSISLNVSVSSAGAGLLGNDGYVKIYYDSQDYDSRIELPTNTVVKVESIKTYNQSSETDVFSSGETATIRSVVSDPLGAQDISGAKISIISPNGTVLVNDEPMDMESSDSSSPAAWNQYIYNYSIPEDAVSGEYLIKVTGVESNGVINQMYGRFFLPCGVSLGPNHSVNASSPSTVYFNHTITNTGMGANIFEITLISQNGYNVSLYSSDGSLMGYDSNGDGVWDYVNPDYDTDGNGMPDTGLLRPGESFEIKVAVQIPENATEWENVTVSAESLYSFCNDTARDTVHVPEFSSIALPLIFSIAVPIVVSKKKNMKKR